MDVFDLYAEQEFSPEERIEKILGHYSGGDVTVACWEPGQMSSDHAHPEAVEIYMCLQGGGTMRSESGTSEIVPGSFVVHPRGEFKQFTNGPERTLLFRVRYGDDVRMIARGEGETAGPLLFDEEERQ
jgi:quercetin dioxygenase-like cupin family protein